MAMQWPFFISSLILGFGWILMYGPAGFVSVQVRARSSAACRGTSTPSRAWRSPRPSPWPRSPTCSAPTRCGSPTPRWSRPPRSAAPARCGSSARSSSRCCGRPVVYSSILVFSMSVETLSVPAALRPAGRHRRLLDVPVPQRPAVGRPRLHRAGRRLGGHPVRHDQPGRRPGQAAQGRRPLRLRARQGHPPPQARAGLGQVGQRRLHRVLRDLRRADPDPRAWCSGPSR